MYLHIMHHSMQIMILRKRGKKPSGPDRDAVLDVIRAAWEEGLLNQTKAAHALGMHQSQVSKIINGRFRRPTGNAERLFKYAEQLLKKRLPSSAENELKAQLVKRLWAAWDGTAAGQRALVEILDGARRLRTTRR